MQTKQILLLLIAIMGLGAACSAGAVEETTAEPTVEALPTESATELEPSPATTPTVSSTPSETAVERDLTPTPNPFITLSPTLAVSLTPTSPSLKDLLSHYRAWQGGTFNSRWYLLRRPLNRPDMVPQAVEIVDSVTLQTTGPLPMHQISQREDYCQLGGAVYSTDHINEEQLPLDFSIESSQHRFLYRFTISIGNETTIVEYDNGGDFCYSASP